MLDRHAIAESLSTVQPDHQPVQLDDSAACFDGTTDGSGEAGLWATETMNDPAARWNCSKA